MSLTIPAPTFGDEEPEHRSAYEQLLTQIAGLRGRLDALEDMAEQARPDRPSPCFSWCDRHDANPREHISAKVGLPIPDGLKVEYDDLLSFTLFNGDEFTGGTDFSINAQGNGVCVDRERAEAFFDELITFAAQGRALLRLLDETRPGYDTPEGDR